MRFRTVLGQIRTFFVDNNNFDWLGWSYQSFRNPFGRENEHAFILRKYPYGMGLLSCYLSFLGWLSICDDTGAQPVVDLWSHFYSNSHENKCDRFRVNAWEYYFAPASQLTLKSAAKCKRVSFSSGYTPKDALVFFDNTPITREIIRRWVPVDEKYMQLKPAILKRFQKTYKDLFGKNRVLGVMIRDGYICMANQTKTESAEVTEVDIKGHPVQPDVHELILDCKRHLEEWDCQSLFLVTETDYTVNLFRESFGDHLLTTERPRIHIDDYDLPQYTKSFREKFKNGYTMVANNIDYLEEVFLLSKCSSIIAGKCSGSMVAAIWNKGEYEHQNIVQSGLY